MGLFTCNKNNNESIIKQILDFRAHTWFHLQTVLLNTRMINSVASIKDLPERNPLVLTCIVIKLFIQKLVHIHSKPGTGMEVINCAAGRESVLFGLFFFIPCIEYFESTKD